MRRPLVAGNWKMNGTAASAAALARGVAVGVTATGAAQVAVFPPHVHMEAVRAALDGSAVEWGGQDVAAEESGAFTGDVAASMLADLGCSLVLVGHSERRTLRGETSALVARKFARARATGLTPVLCVGETEAERDAGATEAVVAEQIDAVLSNVGSAGMDGSVIAYEPVWAIGTGRTATPEQAQAVHAFIRARITAADAMLGAQTRILYGGSVKSANARELFAMEDIDGGLVGGASLEAGEFVSICQAAG